MLYRDLAEAYERVEATTKRLEMTDLLVALFRGVPREEIDRVVYLTAGRVFPDYEGYELGLAERLAIRAIAQAAGDREATIEDDWKRTGDLGLVAEERLATRKQTRFGGEALTVAKVYKNLRDIAVTGGSGSQERKLRYFEELLVDATPKEAKYIARTVVGKMRLGVADMTIVDALADAYASKEDRDRVERAYNVCSDLGEVARVLATKGADGLEDIHLRLFRPIRSMLAERLETLEEIMERLGRCALEYKYDGLRVQAHVSKDKIRLYSRQLENITQQFPEIVEGLRPAIRAKEAIVEGEAVPVDANTGEFLPFQEVSRRRGRKTDVARMAEEFPVTLFTFDCLLKEGEDLTRQPYTERREVLDKILKENESIRIATRKVTDDPKLAEGFFNEALQMGCEGLMAKALTSTYDAGARGFQWIKFKKEYSTAMSDTIDLVAVGGFAGRGKRAGTYGALLMAAYDASADVFRTTCKLGTGFDDEALFGLKDRFKDAVRGKRPARVDSALTPDAWFEPTQVLEVKGAEITVSPVHTCARDAIRKGAGLAVRFPRFTGRWRDDKKAEDATTQKELLEMYRAQLKQAREGTPGEGRRWRSGPAARGGKCGGPCVQTTPWVPKLVSRKTNGTHNILKTMVGGQQRPLGTMAVIPTQQYWPVGSVAVWYGLLVYQILRDRYRTWTERFFLAACFFFGTYPLADILFFTAPNEGVATLWAETSFSALTLAATFFALFAVVFYTRMRRILLLAFVPTAIILPVLWFSLVDHLESLVVSGPPWQGYWNGTVYTIWIGVIVAYAVVAAYALFRTYREVRAQSPKLRNRMLVLLAGTILALGIGLATNTLRYYTSQSVLPLLSTALVIPGIAIFITLSPAAGERFSSYVRRWKARQYDVKGAFLTYSDGTLIFSKVAPGQAMIDEDLFGATLDVIQNFMRTSFPSLRGALRAIRHGEYTLVMERGRFTYLTIVLEGMENDQLRRYMRDLLLNFEEENRPILERWRGVPSDALGTDEFISSIMAGA